MSYTTFFTRDGARRVTRRNKTDDASPETVYNRQDFTYNQRNQVTQISNTVAGGLGTADATRSCGYAGDGPMISLTDGTASPSSLAWHGGRLAYEVNGTDKALYRWSSVGLVEFVPAVAANRAYPSVDQWGHTTRVTGVELQNRYWSSAPGQVLASQEQIGSTPPSRNRVVAGAKWSRLGTQSVQLDVDRVGQVFLPDEQILACPDEGAVPLVLADEEAPKKKKDPADNRNENPPEMGSEDLFNPNVDEIPDVRAREMVRRIVERLREIYRTREKPKDDPLALPDDPDDALRRKYWPSRPAGWPTNWYWPPDGNYRRPADWRRLPEGGSPPEGHDNDQMRVPVLPKSGLQGPAGSVDDDPEKRDERFKRGPRGADGGYRAPEPWPPESKGEGGPKAVEKQPGLPPLLPKGKRLVWFHRFVTDDKGELVHEMSLRPEDEPPPGFERFP